METTYTLLQKFLLAATMGSAVVLNNYGAIITEIMKKTLLWK